MCVCVRSKDKAKGSEKAEKGKKEIVGKCRYGVFSS